MMDRSKGAWFMGWLVTRKGSDTSGNYGHKGVKGRRGGSAPGGGHSLIGISAGMPQEEVQRKIAEYREAQAQKKVSGKKIGPAAGTPANFEDGTDMKALFGAYTGGDARVKVGNVGLTGPGVEDDWTDIKLDALTSETGLDEADVDRALITWEVTSNDNHLRALSMQEAVAEEFGVPLSDWQKIKLAEQRELREGYIEQYTPHAEKYGEDPASYLPENMKDIMPRSEERAFVREMHKQTQEAFYEAGYKPGDTVRLFRGVGTDKNVKAGEVADLNQNAMSSWTALVDPTATGFAKNATYRKQNGVVLVMDVPIESVLSTSRTGFGMFGESEFIVLGTPGNQASVGLVYYR